MKITSFRDLRVWQLAMDLVELVHRLTRSFPRNEIYGLTSQVRRASVSVPSNIAEGYGRGSRREYLQFLYIAQGSLKELETQTILAHQLNYVTANQADRILLESEVLGKMLGSLVR